jgi:FAD/FMN-containing dehydrogenase
MEGFLARCSLGLLVVLNNPLTFSGLTDSTQPHFKQLGSDVPVHTKELSGWGRFPRALCRVALLTRPLADVEGWSRYTCLTPRGLGRSYGDASLAPEGGLVLDTTRQCRILELDRNRGLITAESGTSLAAILDYIIPEGWFLPVTPGTKFVTLGGALAGNVHGKNHHRAGAISDHVESLVILTEQGGIPCRPDAHPDLFRATLGGFGLTGLIVSATLRLKRIETAGIAITVRKARDLDSLLTILADEEDHFEYSLAWIDTYARGKALGRSIAMFGEHAKLADWTCTTTPLQNRWRRTIALPAMFGSWVIGRHANRILNSIYFHLPRSASGLVSLDRWFYPLDAYLDWNTWYGKQGFVQYQCVLPRTSDPERGIRRMLEALARYKAGSLVAGLKRMSEDRVLLPFGMPGYTFAIDLDRRLGGLTALLEEFDRIVLDHGGRVALSKDSRLSPGVFRQMYPEYRKWYEVVQRYAPTRRFYSRLGMRLEL